MFTPSGCALRRRLFAVPQRGRVGERCRQTGRPGRPPDLPRRRTLSRAPGPRGRPFRSRTRVMQASRSVAVDAQRAGAAGAVMAGVAVHQAAVQMAADVFQPLEDRGGGVHRHQEGLPPGRIDLTRPVALDGEGDRAGWQAGVRGGIVFRHSSTGRTAKGCRVSGRAQRCRSYGRSGRRFPRPWPAWWWPCRRPG